MKIGIVGAFACFSLVTGLWAAEDDTPTFRSDTRLVVLHATVTDKEGRILQSLPKSAFQVYENNVGQDIKIFRREDVPVSLGLVIDNSASMRNKRERVEAAALALVKASNPNDEVFIVNFNEEPSLDQEFTNDSKLLEQTIRRVDSRGATAMRDAVQMGIDHLVNKGSKDKKVLLVVTDGEDNESRKATLGSILADAQESGVLVYAVGLLNEENANAAKRARRDLDAVSFATGGQAYYPRNVDEIGVIAQNIAHDVRNQYTIAYSPTNQSLDGSFRQIRVLVSDPGAVVRTRTGYYANAEVARR